MCRAYDGASHEHSSVDMEKCQTLFCLEYLGISLNTGWTSLWASDLMDFWASVGNTVFILGFAVHGFAAACRERSVQHLACPSNTASSALTCFPTRKPPHSTHWTMVKISRVNLMFITSSSSLAVFLANLVPEFLKGSILDIITSLWRAHRMSIINARGKALGTAGAVLRVGEIYSVKGNGKLNILFSCWGIWSISILFCLHFKCCFLIFRHLWTFSFSLLWDPLLWG